MNWAERVTAETLARRAAAVKDPGDRPSGPTAPLRTVGAGELSVAPARAYRAAEAAGWRVVATVAEGWWATRSDGRPMTTPRIVRSIALRCSREGRLTVGLWHEPDGWQWGMDPDGRRYGAKDWLEMIKNG